MRAPPDRAAAAVAPGHSVRDVKKSPHVQPALETPQTAFCTAIDTFASILTFDLAHFVQRRYGSARGGGLLRPERNEGAHPRGACPDGRNGAGARQARTVPSGRD